MHANLIPFSIAAGLNPYACLGASYGPTEVHRLLLFPSKKKIHTTDISNAQPSALLFKTFY